MELCAICKKKRQECSQECVLKPYGPANKWPEKYACLVMVFGMKNVVRILSETDPSQRQACVDSLCFEAEARIRDPVHGCVGIIHRLQRRLQQLELSLKFAKEELAVIKHRQNNQHLVLRSLL
ncbi:unnamed protein product [Eruca vesicaria subsp. sativa]|uniref:LOB domain-containing protein n=1 Tax=Eruca vesicaria subsp. sativa TaxID=29727 RepID=A0ABC8KAD0_ERUVS|nr:unnamed protein product [Eruca vesicaria subsp. sativa]